MKRAPELKARRHGKASDCVFAARGGRKDCVRRVLTAAEGGVSGFAAVVTFSVVVCLATGHARGAQVDRVRRLRRAWPSLPCGISRARWGATLGKLAVGIRVTLPDGGAIGWGRACLRESVDILFILLLIGVETYTIGQAGSRFDDLTSFFAALRLLGELQPAWMQHANFLFSVWTWGNVATLCFTKQRRALHDFLAGTVVVRKEFAKCGEKEIVISCFAQSAGLSKSLESSGVSIARRCW